MVPWMHHPDDCRVIKVEKVNFGQFGREIYTSRSRRFSPEKHHLLSDCHCAVQGMLFHAWWLTLPPTVLFFSVTKWSSKYLTEPCDLSELMYSSARLHLSWGAQTRALSINWQKLRKTCLTAQTTSKATKSESESESRWRMKHVEQCLAAPSKKEKKSEKINKNYTLMDY